MCIAARITKSSYIFYATSEILAQNLQEEIPIDMYKDVADKFRTWLFPRHNFTLMVLRTEFLVFATERIINGSFTGGFDLHLDKLNGNWTQHLPNMDYAVFSDGHWFLRPNYLFENGNLIGCVYCGEAGVQDLGPGFAIRRAFQAAFNYINKCVECSGTETDSGFNLDVLKLP